MIYTIKYFYFYCCCRSQEINMKTAMNNSETAMNKAKGSFYKCSIQNDQTVSWRLCCSLYMQITCKCMFIPPPTLSLYIYLSIHSYFEGFYDSLFLQVLCVYIYLYTDKYIDSCAKIILLAISRGHTLNDF